VTAKQTLVLVDLDERRARPISDEFKQRIRRFEGDDLELA
jgi:acyl-CoA thioesterase FadM